MTMSQSDWKPIFGVTPIPRFPPNKVASGGKSVIWDGWFPPPIRTTASTTTTEVPDEEDDTFSHGDVTFILVSSALVLLMIPGLGFFYSGLTRVTSALSLILISFWSLALVSLQWFVIGYSLTFSSTGSSFIGNFDHVFLTGGIFSNPAPLAPHLPGPLFVLYQGMFAAITPALIFGAVAERFRFLPATLFIPLWTTLVYDPLAYWAWNPNGWGAVLGGLDFAGGTPVHISSGGAALAYAIILGKRQKTTHSVPHNMSYVLLGTALLWFGWFGFNGGSALAASSQAVAATLATHLSACAGAITGLILAYCKSRTYSALGFCSGAIAGLVAITPAAGFVSPLSSLVFGCVGAVTCHVGVRIVQLFCCDDALEVFGNHGVGGIVGNLLTGVFAEKIFGAMDGGGLDGNWEQCLKQLADTVAGFCWSFVVTLILLLILNIIPGMKLRLSEGAERVGPDVGEHGEQCYEWVVEEQSKARAGVWHTTLSPHPHHIDSSPSSEDEIMQHNNTHTSCGGGFDGPGRQFDYLAQVQQQTQKQSHQNKGTQYHGLK